MAARIYKKGGPKDLTKEAIYKTEENSPTEENLPLVYLMAGVRNAIFNTNDICPELSPTAVTMLLYINQFKFCSKKFLTRNFRVGLKAMYKNVYDLEGEGYIEEYSPRQMIEVMVPRYTEGMGKHYSVEEKQTANRYCITQKGKKVVSYFEKQVRIALDDVKPIVSHPISECYREKNFGTG